MPLDQWWSVGLSLPCQREQHPCPDILSSRHRYRPASASTGSALFSRHSPPCTWASLQLLKIVDQAVCLFSFYKFKGTLSEWSLIDIWACLCVFLFQDIDWVQTEKHVFEQASNHPFLVGLHSCFQTESRWERFSGWITWSLQHLGKVVKNLEKIITLWQNILAIYRRHPVLINSTQISK